MSVFSSVFGKKKGGSGFGNFFRGVGKGVVKGAKTMVAVNTALGAKIVSGVTGGAIPEDAVNNVLAFRNKLLPKALQPASPEVQEQAAAEIALAASTDQADPQTAQAMADESYSRMVAAGATQDEAKSVARAAKESAKTAAGLVAADYKEEGAGVIKGAIDGMISGAATAFLDKTAAGGRVKEEATEDAMKQYMPFLLGGAGLLAVLLFRK